MTPLVARWKRHAEKIGNFQARFILTVFYFILFSIPSIIALAKDSLKLRARNTSWLGRVMEDCYGSIEELRRQW